MTCGTSINENKQDDMRHHYHNPKIRLAVFWTVALAIGLFAFYLFHVSLLTRLANVWIVNDSLQKADAILVLSGSLESRTRGAAELYKNGLAPRVLYTDVRLFQSEPDHMGQMLTQLGVPKTALTPIGHHVKNTWDESQALKEWVSENGARKVIVVTDIFHTRRVRWLFKKELSSLNGTVQVAASRHLAYQADNWWRNEAGISDFCYEWVKLPFYRFRY